MKTLLFIVFFIIYQTHSQSVYLVANNVFTAYNETATLNCTVVATNSTLLNDTAFNITIQNPVGQILSHNNDNYTLIVDIHNVDVTDRGEYICKAEREDQVLKSTFTLFVQFNLKVINTPLTVNQSLGTNTSFNCTFNHKLDTIKWIKNNVELININTTAYQTTFIVNSITFNDMAVYKCIGQFLEFTAQAEAALVIKEYIPLYIDGSTNIVVSSKDVQYVSCKIYGFPPPMYLWIYNGTNVSNSSVHGGPYVTQNGSLILTDALPSYTGIYTCFGIDSITNTNTNVSIIYNIIINHLEGNQSVVNWYIFAIIAIVVVTILSLIAIGVYFICANTDICYNVEQQKMKKNENKLRKQLKSQEVSDNEFGFYAPTGNFIYNDDEVSSNESNHLIEHTEMETNDMIHTTITEYTPHTQEIIKTRLPPVSKYKYLTNPDTIDVATQPVIPLIIPDSTPLNDIETQSDDTLLQSNHKSSLQSSKKRMSSNNMSPKKQKTKPSTQNSNDNTYTTFTTVPVMPPSTTAPIVPMVATETMKDNVPKLIGSKKEPKWTIEQDQTPKQSSDGTYYMETVYIPPPPSDDEDNQSHKDEDVALNKESVIVVHTAVNDTPPTKSNNSKPFAMASESLSIKMDAINESEHTSDNESTFDLEKIMEQHTATSNIWPWKPTIQLTQSILEPNPIQSENNSETVKKQLQSTTTNEVSHSHEKSISKRRKSVTSVETRNKLLEKRRRSSTGEIDLKASEIKYSSLKNEGKGKPTNDSKPTEEKSKKEKKGTIKKISKKKKDSIYSADVFY